MGNTKSYSMQVWNTIIHTAMIGTDKKQPDPADWPEGLAEAASLINENAATDKEEKFLQLASVAFNFRQSGVMPLQKEIAMPVVPEEEKSYCSAAASQALNDILSEDNPALLKLWLEECDKKQQIVEPGMVHLLLPVAVQQKKLQLLIASCCGRRGEWLSRFNESWKFSLAQTDEEIWQTGSTEQRKEILKQIRKNKPALAREWLQQTWPQEDANTKLVFLELLYEQAGEEDISFLESLSAEKSKKVKEAAVEILKCIPGSAVVQQYRDILQQAVQLKKEKGMLGIGSKTVLQFQLPEIPEAIFKTGINRLASQKNVSDESFILYQLISFTPPHFWESHLGCSPSEVITLFNKSDEGKAMLPAIGLAAGRFAAANWAVLLINDQNRFYLDLIRFLPKKEKEQYLINNIGPAADTVIACAVKEEEEWGLELTKVIFRHTAKNIYQYNRSFYSQHIRSIPPHIVAELERCTPPEEQFRATWSNTSEYIIKLITLKIQTIKAFNA